MCLQPFQCQIPNAYVLIVALHGCAAYGDANLEGREGEDDGWVGVMEGIAEIMEEISKANDADEKKNCC